MCFVCQKVTFSMLGILLKTIKALGLRKALYMCSSKIFPVKVRCRDLCLTLLHGKKGLEMGGPSQVFQSGNLIPVYPIIGSLDGCNFSSKTIWEGDITAGQTYAFSHSRPKGYQFISEAANLSVIPSQSYDFILASHVLEHTANPLKAITEWLRVLRKGGVLLIIVPDPAMTFDHKRSPTTFSHLLEDFQKNVGEDDITHLEEILTYHDLSLDPPAGNFESFKKRSEENYKNRCLHHHVFSEELMREILEYFNSEIKDVFTTAPFHIIALAIKH